MYELPKQLHFVVLKSQRPCLIWLRSHYAEGIWIRSFVSMVTPTVHTNTWWHHDNKVVPPWPHPCVFLCYVEFPVISVIRSYSFCYVCSARADPILSQRFPAGSLLLPRVFAVGSLSVCSTVARFISSALTQPFSCMFTWHFQCRHLVFPVRFATRSIVFHRRVKTRWISGKFPMSFR